MKARWIGAVVAVTLLASMAAMAWLRRYRTAARVGPATIAERLVARAEVVPVDGVAEVRPRADGQVLRVLVREGDRVEAGQLLAELEADSVRAEIDRRQAERNALAAGADAIAAEPRSEEREAAEAEARAARGQHQVALDRAARLERLHRAGSASDSEETEARANAEVAHARVLQAEARLRLTQRGGRPVDVRAARARTTAAEASVAQARVDLDRTRLVAPIAGVVLARRIDPGDTATAGGMGVGPAPFEIADISRLEVRAEVEEMDAPRLALGLRCTLAPMSQGNALGEGTITRLGPRMERRSLGLGDSRVRVDGVVRVAWITPTRGGPWSLGQRVEAEIELAPRRVAAALPRSAVHIQDGRALVWRPRMGGLVWTESAVGLGVADERHVQVFSLVEGQVVMLDPSAR